MHTSQTPAFHEGEAAAREGKPADDNPYPQDAPEYVDWWEGYQMAEDRLEAKRRQQAHNLGA